MSSCCTAGNTILIAVQKQLVATWVELKQLLRQQIGSTMDAVDKVPFFLGYGEVLAFHGNWVPAPCGWVPNTDDVM